MKRLKKNLLTASVIRMEWKENESGAAPIRLRVTYKRKPKYYTISHKGEKLLLDEATWATVENEKTKGGKSQRIVEIRADIKAAESQAAAAFETVTKNNRPFSWERFESEFLLGESHNGFLALFASHLEELRREKRTGTYTAYNTALNAFKGFRKEKELSPHDLTPAMLKDFERYLERGDHQKKKEKEKRGLNKTSIGIYMRVLKVIYNIAADADRSLLENYPFARRQTERAKYKIRTGSGHKGEALTIDQLRKLDSLKFTEAQAEYEEARLIWMFSFHCQGMNMKDISLLKYKDIDGTTIRYIRHKTKDTEAKQSLMEIPLSDAMREIISKLGNPDKRPGSYVFTIIPNGLASEHKRHTQRELTPEERIVQIIQQKTKIVNKRLKQIAEKENEKVKDKGLKLPVITTYWARHTYANLLKESGHSVELIKEALGHSNSKTTMNYLKQFDNDEMRKANEGITKLLKTS